MSKCINNHPTYTPLMGEKRGNLSDIRKKKKIPTKTMSIYCKSLQASLKTALKLGGVCLIWGEVKETALRRVRRGWSSLAP